MNKSSPLWILAIVLVFVIIILNLVMAMRISEQKEKLSNLRINKSINSSFEEKIKTKEKCPDAKGGSENAYLHVKYFYSKFCPWCIKEEPILQKIVKNYGDHIHVIWYNINNCPELVEKYKVSGVPTFIFSTFNNQTEYSHYGFIPEEDLMKLMCDVTGVC